MSRDEHRAFAGTTAMTLLAVVAFLCIVATPQAGHAGGLQSIESCAGPWATASAHLHGAQH